LEFESLWLSKRITWSGIGNANLGNIWTEDLVFEVFKKTAVF